MHVADARRRPLMAWTGGEGTAAERRRQTVVAAGPSHPRAGTRETVGVELRRFCAPKISYV